MILNPGVFAGEGGGIPVKVDILQIICENLTLDDSNPSYTFASEITLDSDGLYFIDYKYYGSDGAYQANNSYQGLSSVTTDDTGTYVRWLSNVSSNCLTLTSSTITDTWRASGCTSVATIYKVEISIVNALDFVAINRDGYLNTASGSYSHAEGRQTAALGEYSHAEGRQTAALGEYSHAEGYKTIASGNYSHAEGRYAQATGIYAHAEGSYTKASNPCAHAEGTNSIASGDFSHAECYITTASGNYSHAEGSGTIAAGLASHAEGFYSAARGEASHASGNTTIAAGYAQTVIGQYNVESSFSNHLFIVGYGSSGTARANVFRVTDTAVYGAGAYNSSGADYAEYFEWADGNPDHEDRVGRFVTLDGEKLRLASPGDDFILGVVSGAASVIGDSFDDQWKGMYLTDIFGRPVMETVEVPAETIQIPREDGGAETVTTIPAREEIRQKLNPDYDHTQKYIPRSERPEWSAVGMMGKLVAVDDGTCEVNGYCTVGESGVATRAEGKTRYRVMARLDENHIRILIL